MRVAIVTPFLDQRHGTERALLEQVKRLASHYHCEVHLYAQRVLDLQVNPPNAAVARDSGAIFWHKVPQFIGPHLIQYPAWVLSNALARYFPRRGRMRFDVTFAAGINSLDADAVVVHALFSRLRELAREGTRATSAGWLRRIHRRGYYALLTALERRIYSNPKVALAAVSRRTAHLLSRYFGRADVRVIPNGVDTSRFSPGARLTSRFQSRERYNFGATDFVLLLIGNDWQVKGVPVILEVMAGAPQLPFRLLVTGEDDSRPFQQTAKRLGIAERCRWERSRPDVLQLYAAADVYVSPTREDSFALPVLEAMACGLPVITSVFAGVSDLIQNEIDGLILTNPNDTRTLSHILKRLYEDSRYREQIAENGSKTAQLWSWDRNAEALWSFLTEIAQKKQHRG